MTRAAVYVGVDEPLQIRDVEVAPPRSGELKLRMAASGVCHSDLSIQNGTIRVDKAMILGHEGAGVVEEIGPDVTGFEPGDHVCLSFVPQCGDCYFCQRGDAVFCEVGAPVASAGTMLDGSCRTTFDGEELPQLSAVGTFAEQIVVPAIAAVKIDPAVDLRSAALIGCAVLTGVGAAMKTASIREGDTVAVIGSGGVGLNAIQGARLAGAGRVIAIDLAPDKLDMARTFGATDVIAAAGNDPIEAVLDLTAGRGTDIAIEAIGNPQTCEQALAMVRKGGEAVIVGLPRVEARFELPLARGLVRYGKTLKGCFYGSSEARTDVPFLVEAYQDGRLQLDALISDEIRLEDVNEAFEAFESGAVTRSVIVY